MTEPALTPEGWAEFEAEGRKATLEFLSRVEGEWCHVIAALALDRKPFGFTRDMVAHLRLSAAGRRRKGDLYEVEERTPDNMAHGCREAAKMDDAISDRIEALLPPTEE